MTESTRPLAWSVRRELWENRSVYIAPLAVAAVVLFGFVISTIGMPARRHATMLLEPAKRRAAIQMPFDAAAMMILIAVMLVGFFYCLDALYGERRDRSILFWKSLPVSDLTSVLAKASIPLVVLPAVGCVVVLVTQVLMLLWSTMILAPSGQAATTWANLHPLDQIVLLLYGVVTAELWYAPIYAWLLLISAWARRTPFLWAVLPPFAVGIFEKIAFNTTTFGQFIGYRFIGHMKAAFNVAPGKHNLESISQITPLHFLATPGLWLGLLFAAACLAAAARLRRNRAPI